MTRIPTDPTEPAPLDEHDESELPHPPATATEELDEGVASETDEGPDAGTSPGVG
jgi:hypothetical protein